MHRSRVIVVIGAIVALLPLLGFPSAWESFFQVVAGLSIIGLSVWSQIDKKLSQKAKAQMRVARKVESVGEVGAPVVSRLDSGPNPNPAPDHGKRVTDFYPKTGQPGRRKSDLGTVPAPSFNINPAPSDDASEEVAN